MFFQPKGVDDHGRPAAVRRAAQHAIARGIVDVEFLIGRTDIPLGQVIEQVIGERGGGAAVGAAGDVAPAIVAAGVDGSAQAGAGGPARIKAGQLVGLAAATVEVLVLGAARVEGSLPQLAQVGIDEAVAVGRDIRGVAGCTIPRAGRRARIACPQQAVLRLAATRESGMRQPLIQFVCKT